MSLLNLQTDSGVIYVLTNKHTGQTYVGMARDVQARWNRHCYEALVLMKDTPLAKAIREYGPDNFTVTVEAFASLEHLREMEGFIAFEKKALVRQGGYTMRAQKVSFNTLFDVTVSEGSDYELSLDTLSPYADFVIEKLRSLVAIYDSTQGPERNAQIDTP
jgi:predicted GIY-YIG superfamily endonuclease